ncbi:hypothetical protein Phum_PHUM564000 [Pediculus humanus corporis]|uniref:C2H2-type domain-containing protein n=1 Tax=Pediculus humanus subsp. corporis TaxID=121224 RepID=E0W0U8_PEDHC|nr:uncharacterized protein Phum_PHUM564000 [Pediculus humanus corporis]EEB19254.1 hypothetical protein Phum_PHUM564000 [Pediculus humanus corporis]
MENTTCRRNFLRFITLYYAAAVAPRLVPPIKRPRLMVAQTRPTKNATTTTTATTPPNANSTNQVKVFPSSQTNNGIVPTATATPTAAVASAPAAPASNPSTAVVAPVTTSKDQIKIYSNPDILICGNCREMFTELQDLLDHKKAYCKLRFTCKCNIINGVKSPSSRKDAAALLCVQCKDAFISAWDLMVHVQAAHMVNIYELGVPKCSNGTQHISPSASPIRKNGVDDDGTDDILLESPDSGKHRENELDQLMDAIDTEGSECCVLNNITLNHNTDSNNSTDEIPSLIGKPINGNAPGPE